MHGEPMQERRRSIEILALRQCGTLAAAEGFGRLAVAGKF